MRYGLCFDMPLDGIGKARNFHKIGWGQIIFFGEGNVDAYCPYVGKMLPDGRVMCAMPSDRYFYELVRYLADVRGVDAVYDDIKHIFEQTKNEIDPKLVEHIFCMALKYGTNYEGAYNIFMHLYYGMVSEECGKHTVLGKLVKMNAIHSLLKCGRTVEQAASDCRGKSAADIYLECNARHIYRY